MNAYRLPAGGQFQAVVNGTPTGLAGCTRTNDCPRADCLRRADALAYRADLAITGIDQCRAFIRADEVNK